MVTKDWKVLLVDDEAELVATLAERLELRGISSRVALDGESAIRAVSEEEPNVMVLDLLMPGMKGIEVLKRVRASHPRVQVILVTGQGKGQEGQEGVKLGAACFMVKPVVLDDLIQAMAAAIDTTQEQGAA